VRTRGIGAAGWNDAMLRLLRHSFPGEMGLAGWTRPGLNRQVRRGERPGSSNCYLMGRWQAQPGVSICPRCRRGDCTSGGTLWRRPSGESWYGARNHSSGVGQSDCRRSGLFRNDRMGHLETQWTTQTLFGR